MDPLSEVGAAGVEVLLRAAVIGVGYLGRIHAIKYQQIPGVQLVAVVDAYPEQARRVGEELSVRYYSDFTEIFSQVDLVTIATPTASHFAIASACLRAGLHVLLEKPMTTHLEEADHLIALAAQHERVLQVGHLKRFHPTVVGLKASGLLMEPRFMDAARLAPFKTRSLDLDVVLDLMIHDVDLVLDFMQSEVVDVDAVGMSVVTDQVDVANARLRFQNGGVANITASRISQEVTRRLKIFQQDGFFTLNFIQNQLSMVRRGAEKVVKAGTELSVMEEVALPVASYDTLETEVRAFCTAVRQGSFPVVSGLDGRRALQVVTRIRQAIYAGNIR
ncbi:MAG: Gfo/Idh/MocA family oxidoreductase [Magnetococcales bacterium]|nr:Gfo/Idh/MocA family oxidoreductase [Magnetococcales bacterium]